MLTLMSVVPSFSVASVYDIDHLLLTRLMIAMRVCLTAMAAFQYQHPPATATRQLLLIPAATTLETKRTTRTQHAARAHTRTGCLSLTHSDTTYTPISG